MNLPSSSRRAPLRAFALLLAAVCTAASAATATDPQTFQFGTITIDQPVARATPPGAKTGLVSFAIENASNDAEHLLRASTPVAAGVVLHQMAQKGGMMTMRAVPSLEIGPGARLELGPGGYHLMLIDLKQPLKPGDRFPLTLTFERLGTVTTFVTVEGMGAAAGGKR